MLPQTYYVLVDGKKHYFQEKINKEELFQNFKFGKNIPNFQQKKKLLLIIVD
jgi:hypothetical protein